MEYREVLLRYIENVGLEEGDSRTFRRFKMDCADALVEIHGESPPQKVFRQQLTEVEDVIEDFADSTLIEGMTLNSFVVSGGKATTQAVGTLTLSSLQSINKLTLKISGTVITPPATIFSAGTVKVYNQIGEELFSGIILLSDVNGAEETFVFDIAKESTNMSIVITLANTIQYTDTSITNFVLEIDDHKLLLPEDFFIPLEVKFEQSSDKRMVSSSEMHQERFERWTPNKLIEDSGLTTAITDFNTVYSTYENQDFDRGVGYFFDRQPEGVYFQWKPSFSGVVTVVYGFLPLNTLAVDEGSIVKFHRAFVDVLVFNASLRGLRKKIAMNPAKTEAEIITNNILLKEYKVEYGKSLHKYTNFMKSSAEPYRIQPMDFLNDPDMELS